MNMKIGLKKYIYALTILIISIIILLIFKGNIEKSSFNNRYDGYFQIEKINESRLEYVRDIISYMYNKDFDAIYSKFTKSGKEQYSNDKNEFKNYIINNIIVSEDIYNDYNAKLEKIGEDGDNRILLFNITIKSYDRGLYEASMRDLKSEKKIYIEVIESGPNDYMINRIFEEEE